MTEDQKRIKEHFLEAEVRDGVPVSAELKAIWKVMLDILEVFIAVCEKYHLRYAMDGGSLLGAIRHKGFIPWDDDMDVQMPRRDYDKLMQILPSELPPRLFLQRAESDPESQMQFARIVNLDTSAIDREDVKKHICKVMGIHVDIFPIDGLPNWTFGNRLHRRASAFCYGVMRYRYSRTDGSWFGWTKKSVACFLCGILGYRRLYRWGDGFFRHTSFDDVEWGATMPANYGFAPHSLRRNDWFKNYCEVPFEYLTVRVPCGYVHQLEQLYGADWKTPKREARFHSAFCMNPHLGYKEILVEQYGYVKEELAKLP